MDLFNGPQSSGHGLVGGILYGPVLTLALVTTNNQNLLLVLFWVQSHLKLPCDEYLCFNFLLLSQNL